MKIGFIWAAFMLLLVVTVSAQPIENRYSDDMPKYQPYSEREATIDPEPMAPPTPPAPVPIDGGVGFLLALGAGYGIKKLSDKKEAA